MATLIVTQAVATNASQSLSAGHWQRSLLGVHRPYPVFVYHADTGSPEVKWNSASSSTGRTNGKNQHPTTERPQLVDADNAGTDGPPAAVARRTCQPALIFQLPCGRFSALCLPVATEHNICTTTRQRWCDSHRSRISA